MKRACIILGMMAILFAIPLLGCVIKIVRGRWDWQEDFGLLIVALLGLMYCSAFGMYLYAYIGLLSSPPVISSCIPVVTRENDTFYEFHDSTRFCKGRIKEDEISTTFTITKGNAEDALYGTDTCEICRFPLREHWKSQTVGSDDVYDDIPAW